MTAKDAWPAVSRTTWIDEPPAVVDESPGWFDEPDKASGGGVDNQEREADERLPDEPANKPHVPMMSLRAVTQTTVEELALQIDEKKLARVIEEVSDRTGRAAHLTARSILLLGQEGGYMTRRVVLQTIMNYLDTWLNRHGTIEELAGTDAGADTWDGPQAA